MTKKLEKLHKEATRAQQKLCDAINKEFPVGQKVTFTAMSGDERLLGTIAAKAKIARPTWLKVFVGEATVSTATDSSTKLATTAFVQAALVAYTSPIPNDGSGHYYFGGGSPYQYPGPIDATLTINGSFAVQSVFETAFVNNATSELAETPWNVNTMSMQALDSGRPVGLRFISSTGYESGAVGYGNSGVGPYAFYTFINTSPLYNLTTGDPTQTQPGGICFGWEGQYNSQECYYARMLIAANAAWSVNYPTGGAGIQPQMQLNAPALTGETLCTLFNYNTDALAAAQFQAQTTDGTTLILAACNGTMDHYAFPASGAIVGTPSGGGLTLMAWNASSGVIQFYAGGYTSSYLWATITTGGLFLIGTTTQVGSALLTVSGQIYGTTLRSAQTTVSSLPSASTAGAGARAFVTDATDTFTAGVGTTVAGSGSNKVPVYSDGTNWIIG